MRRRDFENDDEWRCDGCGRLLGRLLSAGRLHLQFGRHDYIVTTPATSRCPTCRTFNETGHNTQEP